MASDGNLAKEIFLKVVDQVPESEWDHRLAIECNGDQDLFDRVKRLLMAHANPRSDVLGDAFPATSPIDSMDYLDLTNKQLGPYKLQEIIGEGGMGTVFMAEQTEPIHRSVAVKLIKPGMDSRQVVARFKAERQALSLMDHPNIAKIFDGGATDAGHPYFVMELVKGVRITDFCDVHRLDTNARLRLFQQVCHAVQHAHQKGVIHRDIKPSNVLVAMYDDQPVPKVIDFGVAKATGERLTEESLFTRFGQIVGTLAYMSPEQAEFNQLDVDTRSDIYSLGAILYELLSGEPPFERERIKRQPLDETLRMIREDDPTPPSLKLSSAAHGLQTAANRSTSPEKLGFILTRDLDWIVLKSLDKSRVNRYQTANDCQERGQEPNWQSGERTELNPVSLLRLFGV